MTARNRTRSAEFLRCCRKSVAITSKNHFYVGACFEAISDHLMPKNPDTAAH